MDANIPFDESANARAGRRLESRCPAADAHRRRAELLTPRETECLALIAQGLTDKEVGQRLGIARSTVRFHLSNIHKTFGSSSKCTAVYIAAKKNLI